MLSDLFSNENLRLCSDSRVSVLNKRKHQEIEYREHAIGTKPSRKLIASSTAIPYAFLLTHLLANSFQLTKKYRVRYNSNYLLRVNGKFTKYGFAVIENKKKSVIKQNVIQSMLQKAKEIEELVCNRLGALSIPCRNIDKKVIKQVDSGAKQCNFKFKEVLHSFYFILIHYLLTFLLTYLLTYSSGINSLFRASRREIWDE